MTDQPKIDKRKERRDSAVKVDWASIEKDYKAGIMTISAIARDAGISATAISLHAKRRGWKRTLVHKVRRKTTEAVLRSLNEQDEMTHTDSSGIQRAPLDEAAIIDLAVRTQVEVIRDHRKAAGAGRSLTYRMLDELDATTSNINQLADEINDSTDDGKRRAAMMKAISLPSRAATMRDLATAAAKWVAVERQAFGILDDRNVADDNSMVGTVEEMRASILRDIDALGLTMVLPPLPTGLVGNGHANGHGNGHYQGQENEDDQSE